MYKRQRIDSYRGADIINYRVVDTDTRTFVSTSVNTSTLISGSTASLVTSTYMSDNTPITTSAHTLIDNRPTNGSIRSSNRISVNKAITSQGCAILLKIDVHANLLFCIFYFLNALLLDPHFI